MTRRVSRAVGLALALAAGRGAAQTSDQARTACVSAIPDVKIQGCTALIQSRRESDRNLAVAHANRAAAEEAKGLHEAAVADASAAIALNPAYADAYNERAWAYHGAGRDAAGLMDAERAVALNPADAYNLETRAEILERLGRRDKALADYEAALARDPDLKEARDGVQRLQAEH